MRILYVDCDTLRPDHLGCYGYPRNTSPNIDSVATDAVCFDECYCSDAPCLPSRAAMMTGRFGIHTGVVGHGGTAADMRLDGCGRGMQDANRRDNLPSYLKELGLYNVSISTFAERHGAWWFNAGFQETYNNGTYGQESADAVASIALDWLERNKDRDDWFLHVHFWDPHTPHRAPKELGNPFEGTPCPALSWMNEEVLESQRQMVGPHTAQEINEFSDKVNPNQRQLGRVDTIEDFCKNIDNYDTGIYWMDVNIGKIIDMLKAQGIYDEMAIIISADHGENLGEMGSYDEHGTADYYTTRIPLIFKWPGCERNIHVGGFQYNVDLIPTLKDLFGERNKIIEENKKFLPEFLRNAPAPRYDGRSYAPLLCGEPMEERPFIVVSQMAHVCQRAVRFGDWIYIRTYHDGMHLYDEESLFHLTEDPAELHNVADQYPQIVYQAVYYLDHWYTDNMQKQADLCTTDPMWTVIHEGGPFHSKGNMEAYCERLEKTGRGWAVDVLKERHPERF